ncbi:thioesterase family protein [soil metagenome]
MNDQLALFRHKTLIQIRFKDVDSMGHVNNSNHFTYFELARMNYFREVIGEQIDWSKQGIILAHMEIDYKIPILLDDEIWVYSKINRFGSKSFEVDYIIVKMQSGSAVICATGKSVQVCFNYEINQTIPVPSTWREKAEQFEGLIA